MEKKQAPRQQRSNQILIKTMKRGGRSGSQRVLEVDKYGNPLSAAELEFRKKNVDFTKWSWPESNPIAYERKDVKTDKMLKICNYRWPAVGERKGIVQYVTGYGDYAGRAAYLAQPFAEAGYDFISIDNRGFGYSDGTRGHYADLNTVVDDQLEFAYKHDAQYNNATEKVPRFMIGNSLGGPVSLVMSTHSPQDYWKGVSLTVPYFGLCEKDQEQMDKFKPFAKLINIFAPQYRVNVMRGRELKPWVRNWFDDPIYEGCRMSVGNMLESEALMRHFHQNVAQTVTVPFLMIIAGKE
jgi:alpha-beta hydrolase superfamily lysophospholipase